MRYGVLIPRQNHQHLYVNGFPLDWCELHSIISKRFTQSSFSVLSDDGGHDYATAQNSSESLTAQSRLRHAYEPGGLKRSPRRPERHPIYVLNIQMPSADLDASYTPGKTVMGYRDEDAVKSFVLAVVEEFLKRYDFMRPRGSRDTLGTPATQALLSHPAPSGHRASPLSQPLTRPGSAPIAGSMQPPPITPLQQTPRPLSAMSLSRRSQVSTPQSRISFPQAVQSGLSAGLKRKFDADYVVDASGRKRYKWIEEILAVCCGGKHWPLIFQETDTGVLPSTPDHAGRAAQSWSVHSGTPDDHCTPHRAGSVIRTPAAAIPTALDLTTSSQIDFSAADLVHAQVLGQVDRKFICASMPSRRARSSTVVLIDQHAADERVSVEAILSSLCRGLLTASVPITELREPLPAVILSREEGSKLAEPGIREIFARWGIELDVETSALDALQAVSQKGDEQSPSADWLQVAVKAVPTALHARLSRGEASEMTRLIKLYLPVLSAQIGQVEALLRTRNDKDWGEALRWMPSEMLELANSKACRSESLLLSRFTP